MNFALPPLPPGIGRLTDAQIESLYDRYPNAKTTISNCVTCGGRRTFKWWGTGKQVVTYDCPCRDQYLLAHWLWNSGVLPRFQGLGWTDLLRTDFAGGGVYADYVASQEAYVRAGFGLILYGPRGTGKTLVGHLVVKDLIGAGYDCYVTTFAKMVDSYARGWKNEAQAKWFENRVRDAQVLMVDDLGRERNKGEGSVGENMLEEVIRHRVACQMPTILTTNLNPTVPTSLEAAYGGHTLSLLNECSLLCEVDGVDSRTAMNARASEEIRHGLTRPVVI